VRDSDISYEWSKRGVDVDAVNTPGCGCPHHETGEEPVWGTVDIDGYGSEPGECALSCSCHNNFEDAAADKRYVREQCHHWCKCSRHVETISRPSCGLISQEGDPSA